MKTSSGQWQRYLFIVVWSIASIFLGWQLSRTPYSFDSPWSLPNLLLMLLCTIALLIWIPNPIKKEPTAKPTQKGIFALLILGSILLLFAIRNVVGKPLMFGLPVIAILILVLLKRPVDKHEVLYAFVLAVIAGVMGLGAGWITFVGPLAWAILQVLLVLTGLLAGWGILQSTGLQQQGVGISRFLSDGAAAGFKSFGLGLLLALPWAFLLVVLGTVNGETWVNAWWQPISALQAGIAEEAWGRILLVPLLFLLFRLVSQPTRRLLPLCTWWHTGLHICTRRDPWTLRARCSSGLCMPCRRRIFACTAIWRQRSAGISRSIS